MLIWIVTHINQLMFSPITDSPTRVILQVFSFVEVLTELILAIVFTVILILRREDKS